MNEDKVKIDEQPKIDPVIETKPVVKKKGLFARVAEDFFYDSFDTMRRDIRREIIIPEIKNIVCDIVQSVLKTGGTRSSRRGSSVTYNSIYDRNRRGYSENVSRDRRSSAAPSDIIFISRGEAEIVLDTMEDHIDRYGSVSVADYYEMSNAPESLSTYTDSYYGWTSVRGAVIRRTGYRDDDGWVIKLPRPVHLG